LDSKYKKAFALCQNAIYLITTCFSDFHIYISHTKPYIASQCAVSDIRALVHNTTMVIRSIGYAYETGITEDGYSLVRPLIKQIGIL
jgi:hypothetical protein